MKRLLTPWPRLITASGVLAMLVAGVIAREYTPFWFDPDEGCALHGRCDTPASETMLELLWWVELAAFVAVLVGVGLTIAKLPSQPRGFGPPRMSALGQATAAATLCLLTTLAGSFVVLVAMFSATQAGVAALCAFWLIQARLLAGLDRTGGPPERSPRGAWVLGLVASLAAVIAAIGLLVGGRDLDLGGVLVPAAAGVAAAAVVFLARVRPRRAREAV